MFVLIYLLIIFGYVFSRGFYSLPGVLTLLLAFFLFFLIFFVRKNFLSGFSFLTPKPLFIILCLLSFFLYGGLYQIDKFLVFSSYLLLAVNLLFSLIFLNQEKTKNQKKIYFFLLMIAFFLRIFMIWSSPNPVIDVYDYLKNGALSLMQGKNPYSITYTKLYKNVEPDFYSYLPGMLFLTLPSVVIFKDPRYTFVFAELAISLLILKMVKGKKKFLYSLLFLQNPMSLYVIEQSYTEPLILFLLFLTIFFFRNKKNFLTTVTLGIVLSTKQYLLFLLPLFFKLFTPVLKRLYLITGSIIFALLIIFPFFLWNPPDFIHDAILLQLKFPPRYEGLTFFSLLYYLTGITFNFWLSLVLIFIFLFFIYKEKNLFSHHFFYLSSFLYLVLFFFNKWAFLNYYYLISQLFLGGIIFDEEK